MSGPYLLTNEKMESAKIELNSEIYTKDAIIKTAEEFKMLCVVGLESAAGRHIVSLTPNEPTDLERLGQEFCNHCLCNISIEE